MGCGGGDGVGIGGWGVRLGGRGGDGGWGLTNVGP